MNDLKVKTLAALLIIAGLTAAVMAQANGSGVSVIKCRWEKERIRPRPSLSSLASQDELIQQSQRQQQLAAAKASGDRGKVAKLESQITNHQKATAQASQSELPRDGYRYKATFRNEGTKTIKSIDWDYLFLDPTSQQELSRHQFTSDDTIKPGKTKEVTVLYLTPPVKLVSAKFLSRKNSLYTEQVVVTRIQFSDGSIWPQP